MKEQLNNGAILDRAPTPVKQFRLGRCRCRTSLLKWSCPVPRNIRSNALESNLHLRRQRLTYTTLLTQNDEDVKVVQELLRHANSRITLDLHAQAGMPEKQLAHSKVVKMMLEKSAVAQLMDRDLDQEHQETAAISGPILWNGTIDGP
jgi:hypothetical protein